MHRIPLALIAATVVATFTGASPAGAQDTTVTEGVRVQLRYTPGTKPGLVVLPIEGAQGDSVRTILQRDFDFGDRINVIGADGAGIPPVGSGPGGVNYPLFAKLGAAGIVQASLSAAGLQVALHDVAQKKVVGTRLFTLPSTDDAADWRLAVHDVSDQIEFWITGMRGIAATQLAYVSGNRLWVVDSDGANPRMVSEGATMLSPAWHPRGTHIAFSTLSARGEHRLGVTDLVNGGTRWIPSSGGLNITPTFSRDGSIVVYAHGREEGTDLYATAAFTNAPARRITVGRGSENLSPSFSHDGRRLAFMSSRSGHPEVYISDADGTNAELLTTFKFGDQSYRASPDWSPDGRLIAFQSQIAGRFQVMTISLRDRSIKQHTSEGMNEDPSWSPDSRHLVFSSTRTGVKQLYVIDVESGRVRQLTRSGGPRQPAWSPRLAPR